MRYGFIGLGNLGKHLAASLLRAGFDLTVHDLNRAAADDLIERGATWAQSPKDLASVVDAVITCLPSPTASATVLTADDGREFGVPLELAGLTEQIFRRAREQYGGGAWSTQVVKLLEDALHTDLRAPGFPAQLDAQDL
ncbi:MAG TPA: NAD(P)-binding domain-containing protein [Steroidobacteraceae bacterium]|nr:NAD(P)-binding domain-containing protein [Steroidobacteraceae bacterium]